MTKESLTTGRIAERIARIRFQRVGKLYYFNCATFPDLLKGDYVIVETMRGRQMGEVVDFIPPPEGAEDYKSVLRVATPTELLIKQEWEGRQVEALIDCREKAAQLGGFEECKFLAAQYNFDGSMLTILYSAPDNRVNINRLRNELVGYYRAKLDLRQVGPRDVAKLIGGMGACGIPRCCSTFLTDFSPISIKMAKAQGISLNPSEITGMCGRLRCCLVYEYEQYVEARKLLPKRNKRVGTPQGEGRVIDVHPLLDAVTVLIEETQFIVIRDDLMPLDEHEAFEKKARGGCTKREGGGCDCGAKHGADNKTDDDDESEIDYDEDGFDA